MKINVTGVKYSSHSNFLLSPEVYYTFSECVTMESLDKTRTEHLRQWATNKVKEVLGYSENAVVSAIIACLGYYAPFFRITLISSPDNVHCLRSNIQYNYYIYIYFPKIMNLFILLGQWK